MSQSIRNSSFYHYGTMCVGYLPTGGSRGLLHFLSLSRSAGHQQNAIGLSMVDAIFSILNAQKVNGRHELNSCIEIIKERLI